MVLKIGPKCILPLQIKFLELSETEKKALHEFKAEDITVYGTSLQTRTRDVDTTWSPRRPGNARRIRATLRR